MRSIILVIALSLALAAQAFNFTVKDRPSTPPKSRPSSSSAVITDKQINNARFSRRTSSVNNEADKLVNHEARHTMIVDSPIRDSDFHIRSLPEQNDSEPSMDRKTRDTTIIDSKFHNNDFIFPRFNERNALESSVDRKARHTMIVDGHIMNSRFGLRGTDKDSGSETSRDRRDTFIIGGTGSGNRVVELPPRSYNEFIVDGDRVRATHYSGYRGNSVNIMKVGPSVNGPPSAQYRPATANLQAMPTSSNGRPQFSVSASAPPNGPPRVLQGAVINGARFSRRSVQIPPRESST